MLLYYSIDNNLLDQYFVRIRSTSCSTLLLRSSSSAALRDTANSASTRDRLRALSAAMSASTLDRLRALSVAALETASSASILDLLSAV